MLQNPDHILIIPKPSMEKEMLAVDCAIILTGSAWRGQVAVSL